MNPRDLHNDIATSRGISPAAAITGNGTTTSQTIDRQGFESVEFIFMSGVITDGSFSITLFEGDQANMSDEVQVTDPNLLLGTSPVTFADTDDNVVKRIGYRGSKRYVRAKAVQSGATSGGFLACVVVQGGARNAPVT